KEIKNLKSAFQKLKLKLNIEIELSFIYLFCSIKENHRRDELRIPENQMKKRVDIVNKELKNEKFPKYVFKIDSTKMNETETLQKIEATFL
ncbi:MAG TPA: hypothetical protein PLG90_10440, partial [Ignavibacteria bacterium]|nr:hypothetical protein [Ignavibacteria bacterium]